MTRLTPESQREQEHAAMLREALSRPGIREVMHVYENWRRADRAMEPYRSAVRPHETTITTDQANAR